MLPIGTVAIVLITSVLIAMFFGERPHDVVYKGQFWVYFGMDVICIALLVAEVISSYYYKKPRK